MFRNIVYSVCCTVLLCEVVTFEDVIGMRQRSNSFSGMEHKRDEALTRPRSDSLPVITREIQAAIDRWSYLVPKDNVTTTLINIAVINAITHIKLQKEHMKKMKELVNLICSPEVGKEYAHYVQNVYSCIGFAGCTSDNPYKYGRMLSAIADHRCSGSGAHSSLYWSWYREGYFDTLVPQGESSEWDSWN